MKIKETADRLVRFETLAYGDAFVCGDGMWWIKIRDSYENVGGDTFNCVCLDDGGRYYFADNVLVMPQPNAVIALENDE